METTTLKQQVYQVLKKRILSGEYALGEKLNIDSLCREFHVSNSPIREALSLLAADHLAVIRPNAGAHVINLTVQDYNDLTDAYNIMLLGAYEVCCLRQKKEILLQHLEEKMQEFQRCVLFGNDRERLWALLRLDRSFITATENKKGVALFDSDLNLLFLAYVYNHQNRSIDWQHNIQRSQALIQAVRDEDTSQVRAILCERSNPHVTR